MSKYKLKSSKSIIKRFKITANGVCLRHQSCRSHLLQKKTSKRKQQLRKVVEINYADLSRLKTQLLQFKSK